MRVRAFTHPAEFHQHVRPFLDAEEAERTVVIGIVDRFVTDPAGAAALGWGTLTALCVEDAGRVVLVAVKTHGRNLVITSGPNVAVAMIADHIQRHRISIPGVVAPAETASAFVRAWRKLSTERIDPPKGFRLFECTSVRMPSGVPGSFAEAGEADSEILVQWTEAFNAECHEPTPPQDARQSAALKLVQRCAFIWKDPEPVSFANITARTPGSVRVGPVYTPPEKRNRGYASALVASLTQHLLDYGLPRCLLFTDLANPTSNSIYRKIGYVPVSDFHDYRFTPRAG